MNLFKSTPEQKLVDCQEALEFIQAEIISDRGRLHEAKKNGESPEKIFQIESDITTLELGIDRYQSMIKVLQQTISTNGI